MSNFIDQPSPKASSPTNSAVVSCPNEDKIKHYQLEVVTQTRAGNVPISGLPVLIDGCEIGKTNSEGSLLDTTISRKESIAIQVTMQNAAENLKLESFSLTITNINPDAQSYTLGSAVNAINKIQDVLGSGAESLSGDIDYCDEYPCDPALVSMTSTDNPDLFLLKVIVKMATISLQVPYMSQVGAGEKIIVKKSPAILTQQYKGSVICMPTSTKMLLDYWQIKQSDNSEITRNKFMQRCWDDHDDPSVTYPTPWQNWGHLRAVTKDLVDEHCANTYTVSKAPAGTNGKIPGPYADAILGELAKGLPVVSSTFATAGHIMAIRGAVVNHDGTVQWLILNDPYGNLAGEHSVYGALDISAPVGLRGNSTADVINESDDVIGVRDALTALNYYSGDLLAPIDETDPLDPTVVAIKALQGGKHADGRVDPGGSAQRKINRKLSQGTKDSYAKKEKEANLASGEHTERGKHVYYSGQTEARGIGSNHHFMLKGDSWTLVIKNDTPFTLGELTEKLTPNA